VNDVFDTQRFEPSERARGPFQEFFDTAKVVAALSAKEAATEPTTAVIPSRAA